LKKPQISFLIVITSLFILFLTAFFVIRNSPGEPVMISSLSGSSQDISLEKAADDAKLININTADEVCLSSIPGIGETLARRIVDYRRVHGKFQSIDQLLNVEGIGTGKLSAILDLITTGGK